jgi:O-antigen ligase
VQGKWDLVLIALMAGFLVQILRNIDWGSLNAMLNILQTGIQRATFGFATNRLGLFSAIILLACLMLYRPIWGPPESARAVHWARIAFWTLMSCLSAGCLIYSQSRSAWLASIMVIPLALSFKFFRSHGLKLRRLAPVLLVAMVIGAGFFLSNASNILKQRLAPGIDAPSVSNRMSLYEIAWDNWKEHPFIGRGPGTSKLMIQQAGDEHEAVKRYDHLHNVLFDMAAQIGVVGIAFIGLSAFFIVRQAFRSRHAGAGDQKYVLFAVGALVMMLVTGIVNQPFHSPHGVYLVGYLGGICYSLKFAEDSGQNRLPLR